MPSLLARQATSEGAAAPRPPPAHVVVTVHFTPRRPVAACRPVLTLAVPVLILRAGAPRRERCVGRDGTMYKLRVFTTGGTIDKVYFDALSAYQVGEPAVAQIFGAMRVELAYEVTPLMRKDSLDLTDEDRQAICRAVLDAPQDKILITHGTDTMVRTARALQEALAAQPEKRVVLTGALLPGAFRDTDAIFNVGFALGALQAMTGGVRVAMNGRLFDPARVRKDREAGRFVDL